MLKKVFLKKKTKNETKFQNDIDKIKLENSNNIKKIENQVEQQKSTIKNDQLNYSNKLEKIIKEKNELEVELNVIKSKNLDLNNKNNNYDDIKNKYSSIKLEYDHLKVINQNDYKVNKIIVWMFSFMFISLFLRFLVK